MDGRQRVAPGIAAISLGLLDRADDLGRQLAELILVSEPAYRDETLVALDDLSRSCRGNLEFVFAHLAGRKRARLRGGLGGRACAGPSRECRCRRYCGHTASAAGSCGRRCGTRGVPDPRATTRCSMPQRKSGR